MASSQTRITYLFSLTEGTVNYILNQASKQTKPNHHPIFKIHLALQPYFSLLNLFFFYFSEFPSSQKQVSKLLLNDLYKKWQETPPCHCTWQVLAAYLLSFTIFLMFKYPESATAEIFFLLVSILGRCIWFYGLIEKICFCLLQVAIHTN